MPRLFARRSWLLAVAALVCLIPAASEASCACACPSKSAPPRGVPAGNDDGDELLLHHGVR